MCGINLGSNIRNEMRPSRILKKTLYVAFQSYVSYSKYVSYMEIRDEIMSNNIVIDFRYNNNNNL